MLVLIIYWRAFSSPFVYDDLDQIVNNPSLTSWHLFTHRFLYQPVELTTSLLSYHGSTYRPLFWLSLYIDKNLWGVRADAFHTTNILLQVLNANLFFALLRRIKMPVPAAHAAGLLWLSLPVLTEVVVWISARSYQLCTLFILLGLLCVSSYLRGKSITWFSACCVAWVCAFLSNEVAIVTLPIFALLIFRETIPHRRRTLFLGVMISAVCVGVIRYRVGVTSSLTLASFRWTLTVFYKLLAYTLFPLHMSVERSTEMQAARPLLWPLLLATVFILTLICAWLRRRDHPFILAGLTWFVVCVAPFCLFRNYQGLAERYAYLASMGIAVSIVAVSLAPHGTYPRRILALLVCFWGLWNVGRAESRVKDWSDPILLYSSSLLADPQSPTLRYNLGYSFKERGDFNQALSSYNQVLQLDENYPHAFASLGDVYLELGSYAVAQRAYQHALMQAPKDTTVMLNSGVAYQYAGQTAEAQDQYLRILEVDPSMSAAHVNLGVLFIKERRYNEAAHQFAMAIDQKTQDPTPYNNLAVLLQQAGRKDLAAVLYKKVLEFRPNDEEARKNLELLLQP